MSGWIKLHASVIDNEIWQHDPTAWKLFEYLLIRAYTDKSQPPGRLVTTKSLLSDRVNGNRSTTFKALKRLEKAKMITTSGTNRYTLVSICNWENYQGNGNQSGNHEVTAKEPPGNSLSKNKELRKNTTAVEPPKPKPR